MRSPRIIATLLVLPALLLAACGASDSAGSSTPSTSTKADATALTTEAAKYAVQPSSLPDLPALTKTPPAGKKIFFVNSGNGSEQLINAGIVPLAKKLGWDYKSITWSIDNPASANSAVLSAINSGADGVILVGVPIAVLKTSLAAAKAKNVPVVVVAATDTVKDSPGVSHVGNIPVSAAEWTRVAALTTLADAAKRGVDAKVLIVSTSGAPVFSILSKDTAASIKKQCPSCTANVLDVPIADFAAGKAPSATVSYLQAHPDITHVLVVAFPGAMRQALDSAGFTKVQVGGMASTLPGNAGAVSGDFFFWLDTPNGYLGAEALDSLARSFTGGDPGVHNNEPVPPWVITKGADVPANALPEFPTGYGASFTKLWNVG